MTETASPAVTPGIPVEVFRSSLLTMFDEAFGGVAAGEPTTYFTDRGTSLFETLAGIDAETASRSFSDRASNIAAQVNHVRFYLDTLLDGLANGWKPADWAGSWAVGEVSPAEWEALKDRLRASYTQVREFAATNQQWNADLVGGAFGIVAHTAYHLGEIRSSLAALHVPEAPAASDDAAS